MYLKVEDIFKKCQIYGMQNLFNTQLIYDSLNSSDILNTDRFIKMHGL